MKTILSTVLMTLLLAVPGFAQKVLGANYAGIMRMAADSRFLTGVVPSANIVSNAHELSAWYQCLLDEGRFGGVGGFYMASLSFVEYLHGQRGQGGLNNLLRAMAETGSADAAFQQVYRRDVQALRRDWSARLRQQYGRL